MLLTPFIRKQLIAFGVIAAIALGLTVFTYTRVPAMLGIGVFNVKAEFGDTSGLYPQANVTYRGVQVGKVTSLRIGRDGAVVTMRIDSAHDIPQNVSAELHSTSAIGEQYVDLVPRDDNGPYLHDGSVLTTAQTVEMPQIGPVLDQVNRLLESVPQQATKDVLHQVNEGLGGAGPDLGAVVDNSARLVQSAQEQIRATTSLIAGLKPVLGTQAALGDQTVRSANQLAGLTGELAAKDGDLQGLISAGPGTLREAKGLVGGVRSTLPMLLTNLTTSAQVLRTYLPNLQQTLVVYPPTIARLQSTINPRAAEGDVQLDLRAAVNDPPSCSIGYLPVTARRSPADGSVRAVDGTAHCAVAPSNPRSIRGDRNLPCPNTNARAALPAGCGLDFRHGVWPAGTTVASRTIAEGLLDQTDDPASLPGSKPGAMSWRELVLGPLGLVG